MQKNTLHILAISGSLRENSSNAAIVKAFGQLLPDDVAFNIYNGLGRLPHFDGSEDAPPEVLALRKLIQEADGVFICTPEYAFGVPGSLKNALDWTVSSGEFVEKPVAVITASTGGEKAHASILLTLTALSAKITKEATLLISFVRSKLDEQGNLKDHATMEAMQEVASAFMQNCRNTIEKNDPVS